MELVFLLGYLAYWKFCGEFSIQAVKGCMRLRRRHRHVILDTDDGCELMSDPGLGRQSFPLLKKRQAIAYLSAGYGEIAIVAVCIVDGKKLEIHHWYCLVERS